MCQALTKHMAQGHLVVLLGAHARRHCPKHRVELGHRLCRRRCRLAPPGGWYTSLLGQHSRFKIPCGQQLKKAPQLPATLRNFATSSPRGRCPGEFIRKHSGVQLISILCLQRPVPWGVQSARKSQAPHARCPNLQGVAGGPAAAPLPRAQPSINQDVISVGDASGCRHPRRHHAARSSSTGDSLCL